MDRKWEIIYAVSNNDIKKLNMLNVIKEEIEIIKDNYNRDLMTIAENTKNSKIIEFLNLILENSSGQKQINIDVKKILYGNGKLTNKVLDFINKNIHKNPNELKNVFLNLEKDKIINTKEYFGIIQDIMIRCIFHNDIDKYDDLLMFIGKEKIFEYLKNNVTYLDGVYKGKVSKNTAEYLFTFFGSSFIIENLKMFSVIIYEKTDNLVIWESLFGENIFIDISKEILTDSLLKYYSIKLSEKKIINEDLLLYKTKYLIYKYKTSYEYTDNGTFYSGYETHKSLKTTVNSIIKDPCYSDAFKTKIINLIAENNNKLFSANYTNALKTFVNIEVSKLKYEREIPINYAKYLNISVVNKDDKYGIIINKPIKYGDNIYEQKQIISIKNSKIEIVFNEDYLVNPEFDKIIIGEENIFLIKENNVKIFNNEAIPQILQIPKKEFNDDLNYTKELPFFDIPLDLTRTNYIYNKNDDFNFSSIKNNNEIFYCYDLKRKNIMNTIKGDLILFNKTKIEIKGLNTFYEISSRNNFCIYGDEKTSKIIFFNENSVENLIEIPFNVFSLSFILNVNTFAETKKLQGLELKKQLKLFCVFLEKYDLVKYINILKYDALKDLMNWFGNHFLESKIKTKFLSLGIEPIQINHYNNIVEFINNNDFIGLLNYYSKNNIYINTDSEYFKIFFCKIINIINKNINFKFEISSFNSFINCFSKDTTKLENKYINTQKFIYIIQYLLNTNDFDLQKVVFNKDISIMIDNMISIIDPQYNNISINELEDL